MKENLFKINNSFKPSGDQPKAINDLSDGIKNGLRHQTLLGVTGSGKTFTAANVIANVGKPTLVIAHNKTLAAQLAQEYKEFFPENAVHYFVSYYDYYQPEAYMPVSDTYIEKEAMINAEIERLRHASTQALLTRRDVIIVASVSCIYGLGSPEEYEKVNLKISVGGGVSRAELVRKLVGIHFERTSADLEPGLFRAVGNMIEIMPVSEKIIYRVEFNNAVISKILKIDFITRQIMSSPEVFYLFPAKHFITSSDQSEKAFKTIRKELDLQLAKFEKEGKLLEAERIKRRTTYDLALIREIGYCNGIENYSRHFSGKAPGEPPDTLLSYFPHNPDGSADFLTIIDESHVTVPQIAGMHAGDASRKQSLVDYGFRLPSCRDNRPLTFDEFEERVGQTIYTSATPGDYELEKSGAQICPLHSRLLLPVEKIEPNKNAEHVSKCSVVEQVIRPTGLVDPLVEVRPVVESGKYKGQIYDFISEAEKAIKKGGRVIATTLTKKMAEDLSEFLKEKGLSAEYLHSDIKTIDRIEILTNLRKGSKGGGFDVLVGVNLLREGIDLPELTLIGILDADKEGFLRSDTALIQIIGRAARNVDGRVILYADTVTGSMQRAIDETERRRSKQIAYNKKHGITPKTIIKKIRDITEELRSEHQKTVANLIGIDMAMVAESGSTKYLEKLIKQKEKQMNAAVKILDFESAAILRDEINELTKSVEKSSSEKEPKKTNPRGMEGLLA